MSRTIALRADVNAEALRTLARTSGNTRQRRRLRALAAVADGRNRAAAAAIGGMDRQTLRDWVHRFNTEGPDGLLDRRKSGAPSKLTAEQKAELAAVVEKGQDREGMGLGGWRRAELKAVIEEIFGVVYHERSVARLLHELGLAHLSARPRPIAEKADAPEGFTQILPAHASREDRSSAGR
jgi:transposase